MENSQRKRERFQSEKADIAKRGERLTEAIGHQQNLDQAIERRNVLNLRFNNLIENLERAELKLQQEPALGIQNERNDVIKQLDMTKTELNTVTKSITRISKKLTDNGNVIFHAEELFRQINQDLKLVEEENQVRAEEIRKSHESWQNQIDVLESKNAEMIQKIENLEIHNKNLQVELEKCVREHQQYEDRMDTNVQEAIIGMNTSLGILNGTKKRPRTE